MRNIVMPDGRATTQLGFGCSGLNGGLDAKHSRALVATAYEHGIRYFDVAPPYGNGYAESLLAQELGNRRENVVLVSKAGIEPPMTRMGVSVLRALLKPILGSNLASLQKATSRTHTSPPRPPLSSKALLESVERSLRQLNTTKLDGLLLHEIRHLNMTGEIIDVLRQLKRSGIVGLIGLGTSLSDAKRIAEDNPGFFDILQFAWTVGDAMPQPAHRQLNVVHRSIRNGLPKIRERIASSPELERDISLELDLDIRDENNVADLLLAAALAVNECGIVLASSQRVDRIDRFVSIASDPVKIARGKRFQMLWQSRVTLDKVD